MQEKYHDYTGPVSDNEALRLQALLNTDLLYTGENALFNRITNLTKEHLGTATALVSLVEKNRQWFKARCGLSVTETSRNVSFCSYAILAPEVMVVPDATKDERFRNNELVTGPPFIRFYAGAPIIINGNFAIGTLCVIDSKPWKTFSEEHHAFLKDMASILTLLIEHHQTDRTYR